jgi:hypothetical protein
MGRWVTRALRAALERPGPAGARRQGWKQISEVLERLESLGATLATVEATVTLHDAYIRELRQDRERGRTAGRAPRPVRLNGTVYCHKHPCGT